MGVRITRHIVYWHKTGLPKAGMFLIAEQSINNSRQLGAFNFNDGDIYD